MKNLPKILESAANIALIAVALVIISTLTAKFWYPGKAKEMPPEIKAGEKIALEGIDWASSKQTMLLVLQKDCRFCIESIGFYKKLGEKAGNGGNTKVVAVFPSPGEDASKYLAEQGVKVSEVKESGLREINVRGTPTLLLVNQEGKVSKSWIGKLPPEKEAEVLAEL